ncbi:ATP synthase delta chain, chloroplastic-like [Pistacia vera]|uniref:ATP synthase delta chain, chloroplastic-like n=1 Tax=Pistacia vera TaxID=55513 RepID=UPI001262B7F1|nr:ATP synthase delta chain, chloroplastic-like [Pistacia vera]
MASLQQTPTALSLQSNLLSPSLRLPKNPFILNLSAPRRNFTGVKMSATVAGSYAAALADVAKSNNTLDSTSADIEKIEKFFADKSVYDFFANPTIDPEKKRQVIDEISKSSALQPHTANFLNILIDSKRVDAIKDIVKEFEKVYNSLTDTESAVVSSVVQLESEHLAQIAKQVQKLTGAKNVRIKTVIEPSLVAGFTIRYGNAGSKLIDMSVKKQLEEIAAELDLGDIQLAV